MTEDEIEDRRNQAAVRYYEMLMAGRITNDTYNSFMRDLTQWFEAKRQGHAR